MTAIKYLVKSEYFVLLEAKMSLICMIEYPKAISGKGNSMRLFGAPLTKLDPQDAT